MQKGVPPKKWFFSAFLIFGFATTSCLAQYGNYRSPVGAAASGTQLSTNVQKPDRGGHRSWSDYRPSTYSNRPPAYPGRDKPLPQPGIDYQPNSNPYGYGYGYTYPGNSGYYNNYRYNPGPNAQNGSRQGSGR